MSKHNRERRLLWKLGLHRKQIGRKVSHAELKSLLLAMLQHRRTR